MPRECQKPKRERDTRKCYKYNKIRYSAKDYKLEQKIKNKSIQKDANKEINNKQEGFFRGLKQIQYDKPLYIIIPKINILFQIKGITKRGN